MLNNQTVLALSWMIFQSPAFWDLFDHSQPARGCPHWHPPQIHALHLSREAWYRRPTVELFRGREKAEMTRAVFEGTVSLRLPSGKLTVCDIEHGPVEIVDLPIKNGGFL